MGPTDIAAAQSSDDCLRTARLAAYDLSRRTQHLSLRSGGAYGGAYTCSCNFFVSVSVMIPPGVQCVLYKLEIFQHRVVVRFCSSPFCVVDHTHVRCTIPAKTPCMLFSICTVPADLHQRRSHCHRPRPPRTSGSAPRWRCSPRRWRHPSSAWPCCDPGTLWLCCSRPASVEFQRIGNGLVCDTVSAAAGG